jgi:hypothetical protein
VFGSISTVHHCKQVILAEGGRGNQQVGLSSHRKYFLSPPYLIICTSFMYQRHSHNWDHGELTPECWPRSWRPRPSPLFPRTLKPDTLAE